MENFRYADIHCHPTLKAFGHSFDKRKNVRADMWFHQPPSFITKKLHQFTGATKFSQSNFTSLARARAKIVLLSLYPFEKGFFMGSRVHPLLLALIGGWGLEIGFRRIRHLQKHKNYFNDLLSEYEFVLNSNRQQVIDGATHSWQLTTNWQDVELITGQENSIAVIITIEGAHVFNSGLAEFGVATDEASMLANIAKVKSWKYPPLFITLAHNFNNDLCGHARSLQRLGNLVNQNKNMETGLTPLGKKVIDALLDNSNGRCILIDLKHMSLASRQQYMQLLKTDFSEREIPLLVSHGAVTGLSFNGQKINAGCYDIFNEASINFYDEEIIAIAKSGGLFALQMDIGINTDLKKLKSNMPRIANEIPHRSSARIIWNQLQHIAVLLDKLGMFCWGTAAVGSDFDGGINPLPGIFTAEGFEPVAKELEILAGNFLARNTLTLAQNIHTTAEEIVDLFFYGNMVSFLKKNY